jgi:DNA (cytosine-5)-methyltransferase 1
MANSPLTILDLFSGIGGFSYAAERLVGGFKTVAFCEPDGACQRVLNKHWPNTPIFPDVRTLSAEAVKELCPNGLSLITAGFPCQDLSCAGKQLGYDGERSVLFYEIIRLARELRPNFLLLENVRNLLSHQNGETFQETLFQIAKAGYDAEWAVIPASDLGACHRRERIWIVAYATDVLSNGSLGEQRGQLERSTVSKPRNRDWPDAAYANNSRLQRQRPECQLPESSRQGTPPWLHSGAMLSPEWRSYLSKPVLCRGDDGLSNRVDRLKQLGNSIVPQVAAVPLRRIKELAQSNKKEL